MKKLLLPFLTGMFCYVSTAMAQSPMTAQSMNTSKSISFIENKGQVTDQYQVSRTDIDFKIAAGNGLNIFFGKGKMHYQWGQRVVQQSEGISPLHSARDEHSTPTVISTEVTSLRNEMKLRSGEISSHAIGDDDLATENSIVNMYRMDVELIGANPNPRIIREGQKSAFERYFQPWVNKDNSNEGVKAHAFEKITYKEVYPNIDWVFYINQHQQVEHDFIVHPGGKVSDIRIKYSGATSLNIGVDGSLFATTPMGSAKENSPYSFDASGKEVASRFILNNNILSFEVADYSGTLTIDPVLEWGTYFGGSDDDKSNGLAMDKYGDIYMAGGTNSTSNIATTGAHETTFQGGNSFDGGDAYLSKWNADGDLLWATYYGGDNIDVAQGVDCDTSGNVYLGGYTNSSAGISTNNTYQEIKAGNANRYDAFLVKFDSSGIRRWGTYYGGANQEASTSFALTTDQLDHIYITGNTQSTDLPTTAAAHQDARSGGHDIFLAKFGGDGDLIWSTYYGGPGIDHANAIITDNIGDVYITGHTQSTIGIATTGTHQDIHVGDFDAFLTKFDHSGNLIWGTYFGGNGQDQGYSTIIANGKILIGGYSNSISGISTPNSYQAIFGGGHADGFLACFDDIGELDWATYYGGEGIDAIFEVDIDHLGNIYMSGDASSTSNISSIGAIQEGLSGGSNAFIAKFDISGRRVWGTYYGGANWDYARSGLIVDSNFNIYFAGNSISGNGIATHNTYQSSLNGGEDAFLVKFNDCPKPELDNAITGDTELCANEIAQYSIDKADLAEKYAWLLPDGWVGESDSENIEVTLGSNSGTLQVVAISSCGVVSDTQSLDITVLPVPEPEIVNDKSNNVNMLSTTQLFKSYQWNKDGVAISDATESFYMTVNNGVYTVTVINDEGCEAESNAIEVTDGVGISGQDEGLFLEVYPNPAKDVVYINSPVAVNLFVHSLEGKAIKTVLNANEVQLGDLAEGVYFLRIYDLEGNLLKVTKIVKML